MAAWRQQGGNPNGQSFPALSFFCRGKGDLHGAGTEVAGSAGRRCWGSREDPQALSGAAPPAEPASEEAPAPPRPEIRGPALPAGRPPLTVPGRPGLCTNPPVIVVGLRAVCKSVITVCSSYRANSVFYDVALFIQIFIYLHHHHHPSRGLIWPFEVEENKTVGRRVGAGKSRAAVTGTGRGV